MSDPCDNCNMPCCFGCEYAETDDNEPMTKERREYLVGKIHNASEIVNWLSYQSEISDSEQAQLERMTAFLENLRNRIGE